MTKTPPGSPDPEIAGAILEFIRSELLGPDDSVDDQDDLLSGELLDSLAVVRLSTFVQERFRIRVEPADFVIENFQTVEVLARFVQRAAATSHDEVGAADD